MSAHELAAADVIIVVVGRGRRRCQGAAWLKPPPMSSLPLPLQRSQPFSWPSATAGHRAPPSAAPPPPRPPRRPPAAPVDRPMARREVATFMSTDPLERRLLPVGRQLIALIEGSYASLDGETSLALLTDDVSPIGSMGVNRLRLQP